jgi:hypothetical protein
MKKHELIKHAYDNYQAGVSFGRVRDGFEVVSCGRFEMINHIDAVFQSPP